MPDWTNYYIICPFHRWIWICKRYFRHLVPSSGVTPGRCDRNYRWTAVPLSKNKNIGRIGYLPNIDRDLYPQRHFQSIRHIDVGYSLYDLAMGGL